MGLLGEIAEVAVKIACVLSDDSKNSSFSTLDNKNDDSLIMTISVIDTKKLIENFKNNIVYFDSNIYMDKNYNCLFEYMISNHDVTKELEFKLIMLEVQYQEIYNLKKSENTDKA